VDVCDVRDSDDDGLESEGAEVESATVSSWFVEIRLKGGMSKRDKRSMILLTVISTVGSGRVEEDCE
jgi:hypothetical protein